MVLGEQQPKKKRSHRHLDEAGFHVQGAETTMELPADVSTQPSRPGSGARRRRLQQVVRRRLRGRNTRSTEPLAGTTATSNSASTSSPFAASRSTTRGSRRGDAISAAAAPAGVAEPPTVLARPSRVPHASNAATSSATTRRRRYLQGHVLSWPTRTITRATRTSAAPLLSRMLLPTLFSFPPMFASGGVSSTSRTVPGVGDDNASSEAQRASSSSSSPSAASSEAGEIIMQEEEEAGGVVGQQPDAGEQTAAGRRTASSEQLGSRNDRGDTIDRNDSGANALSRSSRGRRRRRVTGGAATNDDADEETSMSADAANEATAGVTPARGRNVASASGMSLTEAVDQATVLFRSVIAGLEANVPGNLAIDTENVQVMFVQVGQSFLLTTRVPTATTPRGATEEEIERLEKRTLQSDAEDKCCICLCEMCVGTDVRQLPCRHFFCTPCIDKWLKLRPTCPVCKASISKPTNKTAAAQPPRVPRPSRTASM